MKTFDLIAHHGLKNEPCNSKVAEKLLLTIHSFANKFLGYSHYKSACGQQQFLVKDVDEQTFDMWVNSLSQYSVSSEINIWRAFLRLLFNYRELNNINAPDAEIDLQFLNFIKELKVSDKKIEYLYNSLITSEISDIEIQKIIQLSDDETHHHKIQYGYEKN
jgi:hypothetical protein